MREIDRYQRAGLREQILDLFGWFRTHRIVAGVLIFFAIGWIAQLAAGPRPATPAELGVGDCIYVRTGSSMDIGQDARPIGDAVDVAPIVLAGRAERASCTMSHGHEVSAVIPLGGSTSGGPSSAAETAAPTPAGTGTDAMSAIRAFAQTRCDASFEDYVGKPEAVSEFTTFAVVPTFADWEAGARRAICLVARKDGQWMGSPARGSRS